MPWQNYYPPQAPVLWRCEDFGGSLRRVRHVPTNQTFDKLLFEPNTPIDQDNCIPEAFRRAKQYAGSDQGIYCEDGVVFNGFQLQSTTGDAGDRTYAHWGTTSNGSFIPVTRVQLVTNPLLPARIRTRVTFGSRIEAQNGTIYEVSQVGKLDKIAFYGLNFHLDASSGAKEYYCTSDNAIADAYLDVQGRVGWYACTFTGTGSYTSSGTDPNTGVGFDCKTPLRLGFGDFEIMDCVFWTAGEHAMAYIEAQQGGFTLIYCRNTAAIGGDARAISQRTGVQLVQRGKHPNVVSNHGGLPAYGPVLIQSNHFNRTGWLGGSAITVVGNLGDQVQITDNTIDSYSAHVLFWIVQSDGGFSTLGPFEPLNYAPGPHLGPSGTCWTTKRAVLRGNVCTVKTATDGGTPIASNIPRSSHSFRGVQAIEIGAFDIQHHPSRPVMQFYGINPTCAGQPGGGVTSGYDTDICADPLDNGTVTFDANTIPAPLSSYSGWHGHSSKARYKKTDLSAQELDALLGTNTAYPPGGGGPPPGTPVNRGFALRGGSRMRFPVSNASGARGFALRGGSRMSVPVIDASAGGRGFALRGGGRMVMPVLGVTGAFGFSVRGGSRMVLPVTAELGPEPPQDPARPGSIATPRWQITTPGSGSGQVSTAGSNAGQLTSAGSGAGQVSNA